MVRVTNKQELDIIDAQYTRIPHQVLREMIVRFPHDITASPADYYRSLGWDIKRSAEGLQCIHRDQAMLLFLQYGG